jgi:hypothetical protein
MVDSIAMPARLAIVDSDAVAVPSCQQCVKAVDTGHAENDDLVRALWTVSSDGVENAYGRAARPSREEVSKTVDPLLHKLFGGSRGLEV